MREDTEKTGDPEPERQIGARGFCSLSVCALPFLHENHAEMFHIIASIPYRPTPLRSWKASSV